MSYFNHLLCKTSYKFVLFFTTYHIGEKLKFAKIGLSAVEQDMRNFFFCFPSEYKKFN